MNKRERMPSPGLEVFRQPTTAIEPRDRAFHNPPFREHDKSCGLITPCGDLDCELRPNFGECVTEHRPLIGAIGEQLRQQRKALSARGEQQNPPLPLLNVSGMYKRV